MEADRDVTSLIFLKLSPSDLMSAAQVCSKWRAVANDKAQLRTWAFDDCTADEVVGTKASVTPMKPKTPQPKLWVNPADFSPLASFETPKSLKNFFTPIARLLDRAGSSNSSGSGSPRTPSPIQNHQRGVFSDIVRRNVKPGRYLGEVDITSSRLSDSIVQLMIRNCPHLHTLRLQHICGVLPYADDRVQARLAAEPDLDNQNHSPIARCGCKQITERAFSKASVHCPNLSSVTLVLQHVAYRKDLRTILAELGALPHLNTLSVELRMPSFGLSVNSEYMWLNNARCGDMEVYALIEAGPPPLQALALNRCDLTDSCVDALAAACPRLEAIELHSPNLESLGWPGLVPAVGLCLKGMMNLTAAALGILTKLDECRFDAWTLPSLKRLRLETKSSLTPDQLLSLSAACPKLESLHLIWETYGGARETHICPLTDANIREYALHLD